MAPEEILFRKQVKKKDGLSAFIAICILVGCFLAFTIVVLAAAPSFFMSGFMTMILIFSGRLFVFGYRNRGGSLVELYPECIVIYNASVDVKLPLDQIRTIVKLPFGGGGEFGPSVRLLGAQLVNGHLIDLAVRDSTNFIPLLLRTSSREYVRDISITDTRTALRYEYRGVLVETPTSEISGWGYGDKTLGESGLLIPYIFLRNGQVLWLLPQNALQVIAQIEELHPSIGEIQALKDPWDKIVNVGLLVGAALIGIGFLLGEASRPIVFGPQSLLPLNTFSRIL